MTTRTAKEIGRLAGRIFNRELPANWAVRSQEDQEDYGVDYEIELTTPGDKATGFIFKIQQKGANAATILADGSTISYSLSTEKLRYYLLDLRIPIIFVVVDVATSKCYWLQLQGNVDVQARFDEAVASGNQTLSLHLSVANRLPETCDQLIAAVQASLDHLTLAGIRRMPTPSTASVLRDERDFDALERSLKLTQALFRSERTQRLIEKGDLNEALRLNQQAFEDKYEPVEGRFSSAMQLVRLVQGIAASQGGGGKAQEEVLLARFNIYHELLRIVRAQRADAALQHYSVFLARTSRLRIGVDRDLGIFFSRVAQRDNEDSFTAMITNAAQQRSTQDVLRELRSAQRQFGELVRCDAWAVIVHAWAELTEALTHFVIRLDQDEFTEAAASVRHWLDEVGTVCFAVAHATADAEQIELCSRNHLRIGTLTDTVERRLEEAREHLAELPDAVRETALAALEAYASALMKDQTPVVSESLSTEDLEGAVRQLTRGLGVDIDDPNDEIARVIRIGIADANPERVVRQCKHLLVRLGSRGLVAEMVGLPTAGSKSVICSKHFYKTTALSLDATYDHFRAKFCAQCTDLEERPSEWRWTREWQEESETLYDQRLSQARSFSK